MMLKTIYFCGWVGSGSSMGDARSPAAFTRVPGFRAGEMLAGNDIESMVRVIGSADALNTISARADCDELPGCRSETDTAPVVDAGDLATLSLFVGGRYGPAAGETIAAQASNDAPAALQALAALVNG